MKTKHILIYGDESGDGDFHTVSFKTKEAMDKYAEKKGIKCVKISGEIESQEIIN